VELRNELRREKRFTEADKIRDAVSATTILKIKDWPFGSHCSRVTLATDIDPAAR
jgi:cysteinyl-tRNA synthetase